MEHFEKQLKQNLKQENLLEPSRNIDDKILDLIAEHEVIRPRPTANKRWIPWAVAASLMAITLYVSIDYSVSNATKTEFDVALESSMLLEQSINQLEHSNVSPAAFMEISKLNNQIATIDQNIQSLIVSDFNDPAALVLINERIRKLNLVKSLYSSSDTFLRI